MAKDRFKREKTHDTKMKTVILRLDYSGVADSTELVKWFDKRFPSAFKERIEHHNREFNIQLRKEDIETISKTLSLPVSVIERETIMRYHRMKDVNCEVTLDISKYYLCMTLKCDNNYDGLDNYVSCFKGAITTFKDNVPYFCPRRLGLRKVRVESKPSMRDFDSIFEEHVYKIPSYGFDNSSFLATDYVDCFEISNLNNLRFNVRGKMDYVKGESGKMEYKSTLDIDAYYQSDALANANINEWLTSANLKAFDVYKYCMKESYLETISE